MAETHEPFADVEPSVIGGGSMPESMIAFSTTDAVTPRDELGWLAYWLMRLHPHAIPAEFETIDLETANDDAKSRLIEEMHQRLGIAPFKTNVIRTS